VLEKLFISKVRVKILKIFLSNPEQEHHVREIVRMTEEEINAIRRELKNLEAAGILVSQPKLNKLVYRINYFCPIITDLKNMIRKDTNLSRMLVALAKDLSGIGVVLITENYTTGDYKDPMDIDVLFVGNPDIPTLSNKMLEIEHEEKKQIRFTVISDDDFAFRKKNRDPFLLKIVHGDRILLIGNENDLII